MLATKDIVLQQLEQSRLDCLKILNDINTENASFRLTKKTASVGFIYRHIGETTNVIGQFFGYENDVEATTLGQTDTGKSYNLETSRILFDQGYATLETLVNETSEQEWLEEIDTPWFGILPRIKLFSIILFHNSHHCGQIASAIVKGKKF